MRYWRLSRNPGTRAFTALVERHLPMVFATALRRARSPEMAEEAAQNTFRCLAARARRVEARESPAPWPHTVAVREAGTRLRAEAARRRAHERFAATLPAVSAMNPAPPPPPVMEHLGEALSSLPERERRLPVVRFLRGCSLRETAEAFSVSGEAARRRSSPPPCAARAWRARRRRAPAAGVEPECAQRSIFIQASGCSMAGGGAL